MGKSLQCSFLLDVLCPHKKYKGFRVFGKCFKCPHYLKFLREMEDEEQKFFDEVERVRAGKSS